MKTMKKIFFNCFTRVSIMFEMMITLQNVPAVLRCPGALVPFFKPARKSANHILGWRLTSSWRRFSW